MAVPPVGQTFLSAHLCRRDILVPSLTFFGFARGARMMRGALYDTRVNVNVPCRLPTTGRPEPVMYPLVIVFPFDEM